MKAVDKTKSTLHSASASRSVSAGSSGRNPVSVKLGSPECMKAALVCSMFQSALQTLSQLRLEILAGLCYQVTFSFNLITHQVTSFNVVTYAMLI